MAEEIIHDAVEKAEHTIKEQLTGFIRELGKYTAATLPVLIGAVVTTGVLPVNDFVTWFVALGILMIAVIVFFLLYKNSAIKKEWEGYLIDFSKRKVIETTEHIDRLQKFEDCNIELRGKIDDLQVANTELRDTNRIAFKQLNDMMRKVIELSVSGNMMEELTDELDKIKEGIIR
jgi:hypothetical protein